MLGHSAQWSDDDCGRIHRRRAVLCPTNSCFHRQHPALEQDVADSNRHPGTTDHARPRKAAFLEFIGIARHGDDRSNPFELPNDLRIADITGVQDGCDTREMLNDRPIKPAMSIGDDADVRLTLGDHGAATGETPSAPCTSLH